MFSRFVEQANVYFAFADSAVNYLLHSKRKKHLEFDNKCFTKQFSVKYQKAASVALSKQRNSSAPNRSRRLLYRQQSDTHRIYQHYVFPCTHGTLFTRLSSILTYIPPSTFLFIGRCILMLIKAPESFKTINLMIKAPVFTLTFHHRYNLNQ